MKIGERLRKQRVVYGWSQQELADKLHISRQSISKWEQNQALPSFANVVAISDLFDISLDDLIREDEELMANFKGQPKFSSVEKIVWLSLGIAVLIFGILLAFEADFEQLTPWFQGIGDIFLIVLLCSLDWKKINQALSKKAVILGVITGILWLVPYLHDFLVSFLQGLSDSTGF